MNNQNNRKYLFIVIFAIILALIASLQLCSKCSDNKSTQGGTEYFAISDILSTIKDKHNYTIINLPELDMSRKVHIPNADNANVEELIAAVLNNTNYTYEISKLNGQNIITITNQVAEEDKNENIIDKDIVIDSIDRNIVVRKQIIPKSYGSQSTAYPLVAQAQKYNDTSDSDPPAYSNASASVSEPDNTISNTSNIQSEQANAKSDNLSPMDSEKRNTNISSEDITNKDQQQHSIYTDEIDYQVKALPSKWSIKTNLLYDATSTINLGVEYLISDKYSIDIPVNWNPWTFSNDKRFKHVLIQPEFRYWKNSPLSGHFFGLHLHWAFYNVGKTHYPFHLKHRYQGWLAGAGLSYGYRWNLSRKFDFEATIGAGYAYLHHSKYEPEVCGPFIKQDGKHYWGITKTALNIIYKF